MDCALPPWVDVINAIPMPETAMVRLDEGEREAIALALDLNADLVLMDDRVGENAAVSLGLEVIGTLGVPGQAAQRGLLIFPEAIARLRATNFRAPPALLERLLAADALRRKEANQPRSPPPTVRLTHFQEQGVKV